ncbi:hypothetical protein ACJIZ3_025109 [Penstemon smallii]|uniref:Uncharacterized protein n=1 Tax=Penstemon smallii TaxID=265156 RepID=A0ABD3TVX9_9LAMI
MMKISGEVVSTKPVSLSRASKLISRFAAVDNGSSPTVSIYLQRTAEAFNNLVQFHENRRFKETSNNLETIPNQRNTDEEIVEKSRSKKKKLNVDEAEVLNGEEKKKKKRRKKNNEGFELVSERQWMVNVYYMGNNMLKFFVEASNLKKAICYNQLP